MNKISLQINDQPKGNHLLTSGILQRKCACGNHAIAGGECAGCGEKKRLSLQTKLKVNELGNIYEQEADRIADQVMAAPTHSKVGRAPLRIQHAAEQLRRQPNLAPVGIDKTLASPGSALEPTLRQDMEQRFGYDFSRVRIHTGEDAVESARAFEANAYTLGNDIVFARGRYSPDTDHGRRLLAHELAHVVQANGTRTGVVFRDAVAPTPTRRIAVDVLSAEEPEDFLVRAAAENLGIDIRVRSMNDMIDQVERISPSGTCVSRLSVFNHGNPSHQAVVGGSKQKGAGGKLEQRPTSGFSLQWLTAGGNQAALNRQRSLMCCDSQMMWYGCSTAGVWAEGGERSRQKISQSARRYTGVLGGFYHDVNEAAAQGATTFRYLGTVNAQSWANALCANVTAATDFNNWRITGSGVVRTVIYGGRELSFRPQGDVGCNCNPATGRISGLVQSAAELRQRASELREQALRPLYERTRGVLGTPVTLPSETDQQRAEREAEERRETESFARIGEAIRSAILERAGFTRGALPSTADEALRVAEIWGLDITRILSALPTLSASFSARVGGTRELSALDSQQRSHEAALSSHGRETFMSALARVRREPFWNRHLSTHTTYMFPDLNGPNRYRGFTQRGTRITDSGQTELVYVIHLTRALFDEGQTEMAAALMIHELSHTLGGSVLRRAMDPFQGQLAGLLADHPQVAALRSGASDAAAARETHVSRIRQMLYEATGYAEEEIFVHLQQLSHQPAVGALRGSDYIGREVTRWIRQLVRIGLPRETLTLILRSVRRRALEAYDERIAAASAGSRERTNLGLDKQLAELLFRMALNDAGV